jgi:DNA-binding MarR family transcriptional regulator
MTVPDVQRADSPHNDNFEDFRMAWLRQVASDRWLNNRAGSVAIALCEHADPATRLARPVQQQIADRLGITDRTVRAVVTGMAQRGHLQVTVRRNQQPNTYRLVLVEGRANV